jgi:N-acetylneuraminic acid mutarotase
MDKFRQFASGLIIFALIGTFIWLSSGSSNKAREVGWTAGWQAVKPFHFARRAAAAIAYHGYLYLVGGIDGTDHYVHQVEYAPILSDGTLGKWRQTSPILEGRFYNAVVAHDSWLYTLGGGSGTPGEGNYPVATVERAAINSDGSLGPWQNIGRMTTPRRGLKAVVYQDTLYAIGGYNGQFLKSTEQSRFQKDGNLSGWQVEQQQSIIDRYIHSAAINGDVIYLLGGHMRNPSQPSYSDVESNHIQKDGSLAPWRIEQHGLQTSRLVAEAFSLGRFLYIAGGHNGSERLTSVEVSRINDDGSLTPWRYTSPLPVPRSAYAAATYDNHVYVLGGGGDTGPLNSVHMASAGLNGELGYR